MESNCTPEVTVDTFYGRMLTEIEQEVLYSLHQIERGATQEIGGILVTRGNFGPYWYVTNRSGYRCESSGRVPTAVHIANLIACYQAAAA